MPDANIEYEIDLEDDTTVPAKLRTEIDKRNKRIIELEAEIEAGKQRVLRDEGFVKAGLPDSKVVQFFRQHYSGDNSSEAIRQAAIEAGVLAETDPEIDAQVGTISAQSRAIAGSEQTINPSTRAAMDEEIEAAAQISSAAVRDVMLKYGQQVR